MLSSPDAPPVLAAARRAAADVDGIDSVDALQWYPTAGRWAFEIIVQRPAGTPHLPARSTWFVVVRTSYPFGTVRVHPASAGGIAATFPHQMANTAGDADVPWRDGHLCLQRPEQTLAIAQDAPEPLEGDNRMLWTMRRTVAWIDAAIAGTLRRDGDPFELPHVHAASADEIVVTREQEGSFRRWRGRPSHGRALLRRWPDSRYAYVRRFSDARGEVIHEDNAVRAGTTTPTDSDVAWVMLDHPPTTEPWGAPITWAQLEAVCSLDVVAQIHSARTCGARPAKIDMVLFGFPVPSRVGGAPSQIRWMCARLPRDRSGKIGSQWEVWFDANYVRTGREVEWVQVDNWSDHQLFGRGALSSAKLRNEPIVLIGAGAVGSHLATYLVRGGCRDLTIIDGEALDVGNLTRHVLSVEHLGRSKAAALALQLRGASPVARVSGISQRVLALGGEVGDAIARATVVIDCTAEDHVPAVLSQLNDDRRRWFFTVALGWKAQRAHIFSMQDIRLDQPAFVEYTTKIVDLERSARKGETAVQPDVGCWHPAFPATGADVAMMTARALQVIDTTSDATPKICTVDQSLDGPPTPALVNP